MSCPDVPDRRPLFSVTHMPLFDSQLWSHERSPLTNWERKRKAEHGSQSAQLLVATQAENAWLAQSSSTQWTGPLTSSREIFPRVRFSRGTLVIHVVKNGLSYLDFRAVANGTRCKSVFWRNTNEEPGAGYLEKWHVDRLMSLCRVCGSLCHQRLFAAKMTLHNKV